MAVSGGADSLALAAATVVEATRQGHPVAAATVDHGLQTGSGRQAARRRRPAARAGLRDGERAAGRVDRPRRARGGRPPGPLRRAVPAGRPTVRCCSGTPSTTRPRRCCWAVPRLRSPVDRRDGAVHQALGPAAARAAPGGHRGRLSPSSGWRRGTTRTTTTRRSPGSGCATRCCRCSRRSSVAGSRRRWPGPASSCRRTPTCSTAWPPTSPGGRWTAPRCSSAVLQPAPAALRRRAVRWWLLAAGVSGLTADHLTRVDRLVAEPGAAWPPSGCPAGSTRSPTAGAAAAAAGRVRLTRRGRRPGAGTAGRAH